jgi:hypothetical protein
LPGVKQRAAVVGGNIANATKMKQIGTETPAETWIGEPQPSA